MDATFPGRFRFVNAGPGGASNVTAACLEKQGSPAKYLTVRVAKK